MLTLGNAPYTYRLQRVHFVGSRLEIFATLPRAMDRSNANFGEGAKPLTILVLLSLCLDIIFESSCLGLGQDEAVHHGSYHLESTSNGYLLCFR